MPVRRDNPKPPGSGGDEAPPAGTALAPAARHHRPTSLRASFEFARDVTIWGRMSKSSVAGLETRLKRATGSLALIYVTPANYRTCAAAFRPSCRSASRARVASAILSFPLPSWERVARIELRGTSRMRGADTRRSRQGDPYPPSRQMPLGHPLPQGEREFIASSWPGLSRPSTNQRHCAA